jgi:hypothetical protein
MKVITVTYLMKVITVMYQKGLNSIAKLTKVTYKCIPERKHFRKYN